MPRGKKVQFKVIPVGNRRAVAMGRLPDGNYMLKLQRPITHKSDIRNGVPVSLAKTVRRKNLLITQITISRDAAQALKMLCNTLIKDPSFRERLMKRLDDAVFASLQELLDLSSISKERAIR